MAGVSIEVRPRMPRGIITSGGFAIGCTSHNHVPVMFACRLWGIDYAACRVMDFRACGSTLENRGLWCKGVEFWGSFVSSGWLVWAGSIRTTATYRIAASLKIPG